MKTQSRAIRILSVILYSAGILLGMALSASAAWGDFEASLFDLSLPGDEKLDTLRCPVLITAGESAKISATFDNPIDQPMDRRIRTHISDGLFTLLREEKTTLTLAPAEKQKLHWTVSADDAVWDRLVLARVYVYRQYPLPSATAACGIVLLNVPIFTGNQILALALVGSLLGFGLGGGLWLASNRPLAGRVRHLTYAMAALGILVLLAMLASLCGWWPSAGFLLALCLLLALSVISYALLS
jgi:hypothetical protein